MNKPHFSKTKFKDWPDEAKLEYMDRYKARAYERKRTLVEMKGGECKRCGYSKCLRALSFHHRDPKQKLMKMTAREIGGTAWEKVLAEVEKCDLLCANCHMEEHADE